MKHELISVAVYACHGTFIYLENYYFILFQNKLHENGYIYLADYSGWYSVPDETFLTESQIIDKTLPNGSKIKVSLESGHQVEWTRETNYLFRLSALQTQLLDWYKQNGKYPLMFNNIVKTFMYLPFYHFVIIIQLQVQGK